MAMGGGSSMVMKKSAGVVDRFMVVYRSVVGNNLMLSIVIRVCFVYGLLTPFLDTYLLIRIWRLMGCGSTDGAVVTSL